MSLRGGTKSHSGRAATTDHRPRGAAGNKSPPAILGPRKNNKALTLALTEDVAYAVRWHAQSCEMTPEATQSLTRRSEVCVFTHQNTPFD